MESVREHTTSVLPQTIESLRNADRERLHAARQGPRVARLHECVNVIGLDGEVNEAQRRSVLEGTERAVEDLPRTRRAKTRKTRRSFARDEHGMSSSERWTSGVRGESARSLRLASRAAACAAMRRERQLSSARTLRARRCAKPCHLRSTRRTESATVTRNAAREPVRERLRVRERRIRGLGGHDLNRQMRAALELTRRSRSSTQPRCAAARRLRAIRARVDARTATTACTEHPPGVNAVGTSVDGSPANRFALAHAARANLIRHIRAPRTTRRRVRASSARLTQRTARATAKIDERIDAAPRAWLSARDPASSP